MTLVDVNDDLLQQAKARIDTSLKRVAKKKFPEDEKVISRSA